MKWNVALATALTVGATAFAAACNTDDLGYPCATEAAPTVDPQKTDGAQGTRLETSALDCRSRLCVRYEGTQSADSMCTNFCDADADCDDGRSTRCARGFQCVVGMKVGPLRGRKVCVCRTFVPEGPTTKPPGGTSPGSRAAFP